MASEAYDMVVVGAGWFGLAAARAYIETHPQEHIAVLEAAESCGGTWSHARLYPGLKSNNMVGSYEYPDFPMDEAVYGVKEGAHIPGATLHRYLTDFARKHGVLQRTQFHSQVDEVEALRSDDEQGPITSWRLTVTTVTNPDDEAATTTTTTTQRTLTTTKLIVATGLTSTPNVPTYPGAETFDKPLFHAKDFCRRAGELQGVARNVVVVGGAKSAFDVAYALAQQPSDSSSSTTTTTTTTTTPTTTVDLVIRPHGHGPVWICPPRLTPLQRRTDTLFHVRALTWFSPCPWGSEAGFGVVQRFLHGTWLGRRMVRALWGVLERDVLARLRYDAHPSTSLAKLRPWQSLFWTGSGTSILNYDTPLFDLVPQGRVRVHVDEVARLAPGGRVELASGAVLDADGVVLSTGWRKASALRFRGLNGAGLGLAPAVDASARRALNARADDAVLALFPALRDQPALRTHEDTSSSSSSSSSNKKKPDADAAEPLRYYRFMVPPALLAARNLAFAGMVSSVSTAMCAAAQAAWITAFMDGRLDRLAATPAAVRDEVMLHTQWGKWRFPCGYGASLPDLVLEGLPYVNMLMRDLGLATHRKPSFWKEVMEPYTPADLAGMWDEWKARQPDLAEG